MRKLETVRVDDVDWSVAPEWRTLLTPDRLRLEAYRKHPDTVTIKDGEHRTVFRLTIDQTAAYWKHCRLNGSRAWFRDLFRGPKAGLEFHRSRELQARGVDTYEPMAWGRIRGRTPRGSFLITRALTDTIPLDQFLADPRFEVPSERRAIAEQMGDYLAKLHRAGVIHPDLHAGNILVRRESDGPRFFLIDLHDIELYSKAPWAKCRENLVILNRWFQLRSSRTDRCRFFRRYRQASPEDRRIEAVHLERDTERSVAELWLSRDARSLRNNRQYRKVKSGAMRGYAPRDWPEHLTKQLADRADKVFEAGGLLKDSRTSTVTDWSAEVDGRLRRYIWKRFRVKRWYGPLADLLRPSPALRSWVNGNAFADRLLPTARPRLMLQRRHILPAESYLLCDRFEGGVPVNEYPGLTSFGERRAVAVEVARLIRRMHDRCVSNRDLKPANLLMRENTPGGREYCLIDLVGVERRPVVVRNTRVRDLARLNIGFPSGGPVTRTDRLRFLFTYLLVGLHGQTGWKDWWRDVGRASLAKVEKNRRRGRPLS